MVTAIDWFHDAREAHRLVEQFVSTILPRVSGEPITRYISAEERLTLNSLHLWVVIEGGLDILTNGRHVLALEGEGIVGPWCYGVPELEFEGRSAGCTIVGYESAAVNRMLSENREALAVWSALVSAHSALYFSKLMRLQAKAQPPEPKYRSFKPGETILKEGEFGREVLCLVRGGAEVFARGAKVGEVHHEELFGALAALTGARRRASVVASEPSVCMVFEIDEFEDLLRSHTGLMSKLLEDIARAMHEANVKIEQLEQRKGGSGWASLWR